MSKSSPMPDEAKVRVMYEAVLDHLLTPPQIKEQLMATQSTEKKWQTVQMHDNIFDGSNNSSAGGWGNRENMLLYSIEKAKTPDIQSLNRLKISLQSANKEFMDGFLGAGGVSALLKAMETRLNRRPTTELDIAILYEIMTCCKAIMNNAVGMDGFMSVKGAIDMIARCLRFEYRLFAIQVLEILSVCCYYSDTAASLVVAGMRMLARSQNEAPFACLSRALVQQDIEVKAAVMQFANSMVMGAAHTNAHALLRSDLNSILLGESFDQAVVQVDSEMELLARIEREADEAEDEEGDAFDSDKPLVNRSLKPPSGSPSVTPSKPARGAFKRLSVSLMSINSSSSTSSTTSALTRSSSISSVQCADEPRVSAARRVSILKTKAIKTLHGPRALSEQKVEAMLRNPSALSGTDRSSTFEVDTAIEVETKISGKTERFTVNPVLGVMAGTLVASKNAEKMESKLVDLWGGKKTKRRWYEVDAESFKWCSGHDKETEYKGVVPISSITEIRNHSTDANLIGTNPHAFEFETPERVFALACESAEEKENWVTALQVSRDASIMAKGTYKSQNRELTSKDLVKFAAMFKKQGMVYQSIAVEDRRHALTNSNLDLNDGRAVAEYLRSEALAAGHSDMLLGIMQELLLIPQSARGTWEAVYAGTKMLCEGKDHTEDVFHSQPVVALINKKAAEGGSAYSQMSKLAMSTMESDQQTQRLKSTIIQLEEQIAQLQLELKESTVHRFQPRSSVFEVSNPVAAAKARSAAAALAHQQAHGGAPAPASHITTETHAEPERHVTTAEEAGTTLPLPPGVPVKPIKRRPPGPPSAAPEEDSGFPAAVPPPLPPQTPPAVPTTPPPVPPAPAPAAPEAGGSSTDAVIDERYVKFVKMKKMLPEGPVRQKMMVDGFTADEIDSFFANGPPTAAAPASTPPPPPVPATPAGGDAVPDERYAKFVKMQKMLPEGAVRQKMMTEGFSPAEIDSFFTNGPPMAAAAATAAPAAPAAAAPDERYAKFVKMQKMLPEGAVRQKMMTEGFSPAEIDSFFTNGPPTTAAAAAAPPAPASEPIPDERYAKFVKMQKMLPEGAVRQKMMTEGFSPAEIDNFFTNGPPMTAGSAPAPSAPSPAGGAADERYAKFVKMQKMLPEGAVRQKMMVEGFSPAEIDSFFTNGPPGGGAAAPAPPAPPAAPAAPAVMDERFAKYVKMQKMLPEGAVRQKMMTDGFSPADIESFFGGGATTAAPAAPAIKVPTFTPLEAIKYAKYEKMLKQSLPEGAVRQKMAADEMSPEDIDRFFVVINGAAAAKAAAAATASAGPAKPAAPKPPTVEPPPEGMAAKPKITPQAKLKGVFWTKLKNSDIKGTVWHRMDEYQMPAEEVKRLEELFGSKVAEPAANKDAASNKDSAADKKGGKKLLSVLDAQRTQNVMIIMGKVRMTAEQILKLIIDLDPETLNQELCHTFFEILPTPEEVEAVKPHKDPLLLDNASQLLFHFNRMPRIIQRLECHEIAFSWGNGANAAASQLGVIECACVELGKSQDNMKKMLSIVLSIGNYLNGGTARGEAYGVGLDIFAKFSNLKASQQNESLMHFLARQAELRDPALLELSEKWVALWAAADISYKQLCGDVTNLDNMVNKMNAEFTRIKDGKDNIGLDGKMEDSKGPAMNPLHRRLNGFLLTAKPRVAQLKQQVKNVETAVEAEMNKYGESLKKTAEDDPCKLFFSTITTFARALRTAVDENAARKLAAEKAAKAAADAQTKEANRAPANGAAHAGGAHSGAPTPTGAAGKAKTENIFGMFHSAQEASSDDVIAEFKLKMAKRMAKNAV